MSEDAAAPGRVCIYTDGGCQQHARFSIGACAYRIEHGSAVIEKATAFLDTTNNRMEMLAAILALEAVEPGPKVLLVSDSRYVIDGCMYWSHNWIRNGWTLKNGDPVKNLDLWLRLTRAHRRHDCEFQHVRGHTGHVQNELVDAMCTEAMRVALQELQNGNPVAADVRRQPSIRET